MYLQNLWMHNPRWFSKRHIAWVKMTYCLAKKKGSEEKENIVKSES